MSENTTFIYGYHAVHLQLMHDPQRVDAIFITRERHDDRIETLLALAKQHAIQINFYSKKELAQLIKHEHHQGVGARLHAKLPVGDLDDLLATRTQPFLLILDGIQDPHNLGACLRSANAAGADAVIVPKDRAVGITDVVSKVASGAAVDTPFFQVTNLARTIASLKERGIWLYGASEHATSLYYEVDLKGPIALVMGSEGQGLRRLTRDSCDFLIRIPMFGSVSSLNVSVATGVCLFEAVRQRQLNQ